jgi:hypothetical protein
MESRGLKRQLQAFAFSFVKSRLFGHIDVATGNAASINCGASKLCLVKKSDPRDVRAIPVTHSKSSTEKCGFCKKLATADVCSALPFFIIEIDRGIWNFILVSPPLKTATALISTLFTFFPLAWFSASRASCCSTLALSQYVRVLRWKSIYLYIPQSPRCEPQEPCTK